MEQIWRLSERHDYESHSRISILPIHEIPGSVYIASDYTARAEKKKKKKKTRLDPTLQPIM
jgi:hypothetical protein